MNKLERRFEQVFESLCEDDYDSVLTLLCPLIDGAGKKMYGIKKTGVRFQKVLKDNNDFLYWVITGGVLTLDKEADFVFIGEGKDKTNLSRAIYSLVRNSLLHEGELSEKIEFVDVAKFGPDGEKVVFPKSLIWALAFMVAYLPCYQDACPKHATLSVSGISTPLHEFWGNKDKVMTFIRKNCFKIRVLNE
ncbi:hypothetical protein K6U26_09955 [Vibrio parahaemolyticus]|uniref:hypothetical protein n=1 Tax=Vibrio parahaemolyticus TaxID=670 RepID=UPI001EEBE838|nr:hypothetical protein [Vibrio parahaemolyticus]EIJ0972611.1 hypothetical protein [Vibrio parahaemolyticus]MCG6484665.1 hypothetical protein [Vibrio parahaemolyticus]